MKCMVMGIVNVTPDSFSDGGKYFKPEEAIRRVRNMFEEGADIVDIGAESTRPGSTPISWEEEWARLEPVLRGLSPQNLRGVSPRNCQSGEANCKKTAMTAVFLREERKSKKEKTGP